MRAVGADAFHAAGFGGKGVVVALADYGFDLLHPSFRTDDGKTRFTSLWNQCAAGEAVADVGSDGGISPALLSGEVLPGELRAADIDRLIYAAEAAGGRAPADAIYDPHAGYYGRHGVGPEGAHGTLMASLAAGSAVGGHTGLAPEATLLAVQLALPDAAWREEDASGRPSWLDVPETALAGWAGWKSYDAAAATVAAIRYLHARALELNPAGIVLNVSLGTWAGAHDGGSPVERELARIAALGEAGAGPPCIVVIGAGNAGNEQGHFAGRVTPAQPVSFDWTMHAADPTQNKLEIWSRSTEPSAMTLSLGDMLQFDLAPGPTRAVVAGGQRIGLVEHVSDVSPGLSRVRVILHPPCFADAAAVRAVMGSDPTLSWRIEVSSGGGSGGDLHAWLERDDGTLERSTLAPFTTASTLSCLAGAAGAIVVGGFELDVATDGTVGGARRFPWASHGPLPWGGDSSAACVPHLAAPAHGVVGAKSKSTGFAYTSGTSAAAAFVSGAAALLIEQAVRAGRRPRRADLLAALLGDSGEGADSRSAAAWDPQIGFGPLALIAPVAAHQPAAGHHHVTLSASSRFENAGTHPRA